jgi:GPI mannosyltransferase 1 subunit M
MTRIDHRHNFSPYNSLLYLSSSEVDSTLIRLESLAFLPQLFLSTIALPLILAKKDLASTMLAQTFAFVSFNKVCTSQVSFIISQSQLITNNSKYFLWYIVLLPFYLPKSSFLAQKSRGLTAICLWVSTQAYWLQQGFQLEFLGKSTFVPGLWIASLLFFLTNAWILNIIISDIGLKSTIL